MTLILSVLLVLIGCRQTADVTPALPEARVRATSSGLTLDGRPWWPAGLNAYQLASDWALNRGCGAEVDLTDFFDSLPEASVTRFNAFQLLAVNKATGTLDFTAIDNVFRAAEAHGQLLIPVLAAQTGACGNEIVKRRAWYSDGWHRTSPMNVMSYEDWIRNAVRRWNSSPALAMWELVGEPEPLLPDDTCPKDASVVLRKFVDEAGGIVRSLDDRHPITVGLTGGGQCGTAGIEYEYVGASPHLDVLQYHDYGADRVPLPGDRYNGLAVRLAQAGRLGKPLLVAEIGQYAGGPCATVGERARDLALKMDGQRAAGTAGALLWAFVPDPRPDKCTFDIGPRDPVRVVLRERNDIG